MLRDAARRLSKAAAASNVQLHTVNSPTSPAEVQAPRGALRLHAPYTARDHCMCRVCRVRRSDSQCPGCELSYGIAITPGKASGLCEYCDKRVNWYGFNSHHFHVPLCLTYTHIGMHYVCVGGIVICATPSLKRSCYGSLGFKRGLRVVCPFSINCHCLCLGIAGARRVLHEELEASGSAQ